MLQGRSGDELGGDHALIWMLFAGLSGTLTAQGTSNMKSRIARLLSVLRADGKPSVASIALIRQNDGNEWCVTILHWPLGLSSENSDSLAALCVQSGGQIHSSYYLLPFVRPMERSVVLTFCIGRFVCFLKTQTAWLLLVLSISVNLYTMLLPTPLGGNGM